MPELLATCCPGLESILAAEALQRLLAPACAARGEARFQGTVNAALELRCADNLYALLGETPAGPHRADLVPLGRALATLPVRERCAEAGIALQGKRPSCAGRPVPGLGLHPWHAGSPRCGFPPGYRW
jgi:hypothetical protein